MNSAGLETSMPISTLTRPWSMSVRVKDVASCLAKYASRSVVAWKAPGSGSKPIRYSKAGGRRVNEKIRGHPQG
jgi:hypothetical protein